MSLFTWQYLKPANVCFVSGCRGRFAVTKWCEQRGNRRSVAAKLVNKKLMRREQVVQELGVLQCLQHPHLVALLDTYETPGSYVLILDMYVNLTFVYLLQFIHIKQ